MSACPYCQAENEDGAPTCFTCGRGLATLTKGSVLASRYEVLSLVGRGGMGTVYRAHDRVLDETVALKVMRTDLNESAARRFRSEIKLARKVTHPNVCRIHDYGEEGPFRYISMELIEGRDLKQSLQHRPLSREEAFEVAIQLAEGLQAIHRVGIVHRDLKTPNVMRDAEGAVRLMDFGIAKQFEAEGSGATATGQIVGTPEYMSPEQVRGEKLDQRSDIYALGIVIFELFTGRVPFRGDTPMATLLKQIQDEVSFEEAQAAGLPGSLAPILAKAMAKDRSHRFSSVAQLAEALREARAALPPVPGPITPAPSRTATVVALAPAPTSPIPTPVPTSVRTEIKTAAMPAAAARPRARPPVAPQVRGRWARPAIAGTAIVVLLGAGAAIVIWAWPKPPLTGDVPPAPVTLPRATEPSAPSAPATSIVTVPAARESPRVQRSARPSPPPVAPPATTLSKPAATTLPAQTPVTHTEPRPPPTTLAAVVEQAGSLQLYVLPWAEVSIDGRTVGTTPLPKQTLPPGRHRLRFIHPRYEPLDREIQVRPGETLRVQVNLEREAKPRK